MSIRNVEKKVVFSVKIPSCLDARMKALKDKIKGQDDVEWSITEDVVRALEKIISRDEEELGRIAQNSSQG